MTDPLTTNRQLAIPTRGSDSGTWDVPNNGNWAIVDTLFGGVVTKSLTNVNVNLSVADQQNALIRLTGTLTGAMSIFFTAPGFYIIDNRCTVGSFFILLANATTTGNKIGVPPGRKCHVYFDGTGMDYVDMPEVGSYLDLPVAAVPAWMSACTVAPWLVCDGSAQPISTYPQLAAILGTSFGGNGVTTFGLPDARGFVRATLNQGTGRLTAGGGGVNGDVLGSIGGNEIMQAHTHANSLSDPGHAHSFPGFVVGGPNIGGGAGFGVAVPNTNGALTGVSINNAAAGGGGSQNVQPTYVGGLTLIKT